MNILKEGYDMKCARSGCHGKGIYFADKIQKSVPYATRKECTIKQIFVCSVNLGRTHVSIKRKRLETIDTKYDR